LTEAVDKYKKYLGKRATSFKLALDSIAKKQNPVVVELGTSRSFVSGGNEGVMSDDSKYWEPNNIDKWDWGAGIFSRVAAEAIEGTNSKFYAVDPCPKAITISSTITDDLESDISFHQTTSTEFLNNFDTKIDLLYMDHHETCEEGARLHLLDSKLIIEKDSLSKDALILIDDVHVKRWSEPIKKVYRKLRNKPRLHFGKGKYSIPYLEESGFDIIYEGYQVVMAKSESI